MVLFSVFRGYEQNKFRYHFGPLLPNRVDHCFDFESRLEFDEDNAQHLTIVDVFKHFNDVFRRRREKHLMKPKFFGNLVSHIFPQKPVLDCDNHSFHLHVLKPIEPRLLIELNCCHENSCVFIAFLEFESTSCLFAQLFGDEKTEVPRRVRKQSRLMQRLNRFPFVCDLHLQLVDFWLIICLNIDLSVVVRKLLRV